MKTLSLPMREIERQVDQIDQHFPEQRPIGNEPPEYEGALELSRDIRGALDNG